MSHKKNATRLKWVVAFFIGLINISVCCIWIPARLQTSQRWIAINAIWDRIEKTIFLFIDGGLNAFFLYLVKSRLISQGFDQYRVLFNFNSCIVVVSLSMDVRRPPISYKILKQLANTMPLGPSHMHDGLKQQFQVICNLYHPKTVTNIPHSYIQFHPLAYMVKLYIELVLTDLIVNVVRSSFTPDYNSPSSNRISSQHPRRGRESTMAEYRPTYNTRITSKVDTPLQDTSLRTSIDTSRAPFSTTEIQKTVSISFDSKTDSKVSFREELAELKPIYPARHSGGNWI
jgi:hypothetical protein